VPDHLSGLRVWQHAGSYLHPVDVLGAMKRLGHFTRLSQARDLALHVLVHLQLLIAIFARVDVALSVYESLFWSVPRIKRTLH